MGASRPKRSLECDLMAQLRACPALQRGERLAWAIDQRDRLDGPRFLVAYAIRCAAHAWVLKCQTAEQARAGGRDAEIRRAQIIAQWRAMAAPLRKARERIARLRRTVAVLTRA